MECLCRHCSTPLEFEPEQQGGEVECPACGGGIVLPLDKPLPASAPVDPEPPVRLRYAVVLPEVAVQHPVEGLLFALAGLGVMTGLLFSTIGQGSLNASLWAVSGFAAAIHFGVLACLFRILANIRWLLKRLVEQGMLREENEDNDD